MNAFEHDHTWIETERTESKNGVTIQRKCEGCGMIVAIGPGHIETGETTVNIEGLPIRMALDL